jgi:effector-binding domain-containing protein/ribosome-associated toxin RatA of RatAB toxin-antitoxin module
MKAIKFIVVILLIMIAFVLIVPFFLADHVVVSQTQLIKAAPATVFHEVNTLENWEKWSPFDADTAMTVSYEGSESGVGAKMLWAGKESGSLTIVESNPYKSIKTEIVYGQDGTTNGIWQFDETPEGVLVTWSLELHDMSYPFEKWFGLAMESIMKPMLTKGLSDLKTLTEVISNPPEISIVDLKAQPSLIIYDSATINGINKLLEKNYGLLFEYIIRKQIPMTGQPFAIYHNWDPNGILYISTGIPVDLDSKRGRKNISYYELPAGKAVTAKHFGGYNTETTHWMIQDYVKDFGLETKDFFWEVYVTDHETEADSANWETDIFYPLK